MHAQSPAENAALAPSDRTFALPLALMVTLYFGIGFITTLNDVLVTHFKDLFRLNNVAALLVQFCFFGAYFVMSVPSGAIIGRIGYKNGIIAALSTVGVGLLLFQPAALLIRYPLFLFALFVVGSGLALLQVAINPYIGALGTPETASSRLNLGGGLNSFAGVLAPRVGAIFIFIAAGASTAQLAHSVRGPYLVLAVCAFALAALTAAVQLPELIERRDTAQVSPGESAWAFRNLRFGAFGIFFYVGAEVAIGSILIGYLGTPAMGGYSHTRAAWFVSFYWGSAMIGRFIGFGALRWIRAHTALTAVAAAAIVLMVVNQAAQGPLALWATVLCGLCNSVMWPCIFPLAIDRLGKATSQGSGILITMVVGGAVIPLAQGWLADHFGYQHSFLLVLLCYAYILFYAVNGYKPGQGSRIDADQPFEVAGTRSEAL